METKVQLSKDELELMQNSNWILTKNGIIEKLSGGLQQLAMKMQNELIGKQKFTEEVARSGYKISRGEKYKGLPYLILDYPRVFGKDDIFAIRTLFWWGNYYSITLHAKGKFAMPVEQSIINAWPSIIKKDYYISFAGDEWNHDLREMMYHPISDFKNENISQILPGSSFIKISRQLKLSQWDDAAATLLEIFREMVEIINL